MQKTESKLKSLAINTFPAYVLLTVSNAGGIFDWPGKGRINMTMPSMESSLDVYAVQ